jgi:hypothetical protein
MPSVLSVVSCRNPYPWRQAAWRRVVIVAILIAAATAGLWWPPLAARWIYVPRVEWLISAIKSDPLLRAAVEDQNRRFARVPEAFTTTMDEAWIAEALGGKGPMIDRLLNTPASARLRKTMSRTFGSVRNIILMDAKGHNVAIAGLTTDFFQGDEPKWLATFGAAPGTRHLSSLERGHDGTFAACWLSEPLNDRDGANPIGAVSIELDAALVFGRLCK